MLYIVTLTEVFATFRRGVFMHKYELLITQNHPSIILRVTLAITWGFLPQNIWRWWGPINLYAQKYMQKRWWGHSNSAYINLIHWNIHIRGPKDSQVLSCPGAIPHTLIPGCQTKEIALGWKGFHLGKSDFIWTNRFQCGKKAFTWAKIIWPGWNCFHLDKSDCTGVKGLFTLWHVWKSFNLGKRAFTSLGPYCTAALQACLNLFIMSPYCQWVCGWHLAEMPSCFMSGDFWDIYA